MSSYYHIYIMRAPSNLKIVHPGLAQPLVSCSLLPHKLLFNIMFFENYICCYMYGEVVNPGYFRSSSAPG